MKPLACGLMFSAAVGFGQAAQTPPAQRPATFRAAANYVSLLVTPHDATGQFTPGLTLGDFHVYEDAVEQTITRFEYSVGARIFSGSNPAPPSAGLVLPSSRPPASVASRLFIIFIDDLHIAPDLTPRLKALLRQVRGILHDNDLVALVSTGYSSIASDPSYDYGHKRFDEAVNKVMGSGATMSQLLTMQQGGDGIAELNHHTHVAFATAHDLLEQMAAMTTVRKAFIWISSGYSLNPLKESRLKIAQQSYNGDDPFANPGMEFKEADLIRQIDDLTRAANRANVTFFPIDPRGLMTSPGAEMREQLSAADVRDFQEQTTSTLRVLADLTGGSAAVNTNDVTGYLQTVDHQMSNYYLLGYQSSNADPQRLVRKIEVRTTRPGVVLTPGVDYRETYTIKR